MSKSGRTLHPAKKSYYYWCGHCAAGSKRKRIGTRKRKHKGRRKVLLLLPCTNKKPYSKAPTWKFIMSRIGPWLDHVDMAAVDCITNHKTKKPFGNDPDI